MNRRYWVRTPEQLKELAAICKTGETTRLLNVAVVWEGFIAGKMKTPWDGNVFVGIAEDGHGRRAAVFRRTGGPQWERIAALNYNQAVSWCTDKLEQVR